MRAGDLDRRITIQAVDYVFDEYGSFEEVWTDINEVRRIGRKIGLELHCTAD